jgi:hypothetical protein
MMRRIVTWGRPILLIGAAILTARCTLPEALQPAAWLEERFTTRVAKVLVDTLPAFDVTVQEPLVLAVAPRADAAGGRRVQARLASLWEGCKRAEAACDQSIRHYAASIAEFAQLGPQSPQRSDLRVVVRPSAYLDEYRMVVGMDPEAEIVAAPLAGDLWVVCVVDRPGALQVLGAGDLRRLGLTKDEAIRLGRRNVDSSLRPLSAVTHLLPDNSFGTIEGGVYESSRLLFHEQWADVAQRLRGPLIVAVPASGMVLYGRASRQVGIAAMQRFAADATEEAKRPISTTVFKWTRRGWQPVPPSS